MAQSLPYSLLVQIHTKPERVIYINRDEIIRCCVDNDFCLGLIHDVSDDHNVTEIITDFAVNSDGRIYCRSQNYLFYIKEDNSIEWE